MFSSEYCKIMKNIYFKGHLWTTASELYWITVGVIIGKTETYSETIIGDVFRTQWNISDGAFGKNSWLYLTVEYFCKTLYIICFTGLWICLGKTKQNPGVLSFISEKIRIGISANLFLNSVLSSHCYLGERN